jgi:GNAT superfamily N-acetyltransferase
MKFIADNIDTMNVRRAEISDKEKVAMLLDKFRSECLEQITGTPLISFTARNSGVKLFESLLNRTDYCIFLLDNDENELIGLITGYLCPMLRNGNLRAEVEEFFVEKEYRGQGNAHLLMDTFFNWCMNHGVTKVNLESENELLRAHGFYSKYGFEIKAKRFVKKV